MPAEKTGTVTVGGIEFSIRKPSYKDWRQFKAAVASTNAKGNGLATIDGIEDLAKACCTSHKPEDLDKLVEDELNLFEELAAVAMQLAGVAEAEHASKSR